MKSLAVALLAFVAGIYGAVVDMPDLRYLRAYPQYNYEGPSEYFLDYAPDLSAYSIDNAIRSICYTGFWQFYSEINYEGGFLGHFFNVNTCQNMTYAPESSSLRYAGSPYGLNDVYHNLYEGKSYTGAEFRGNTNAETVGALDLNVSSVIITGQSPWTFFTGQRYTGVSACMYPRFENVGDNGIELYIDHVINLTYLGLPDNSIRSVAKGCLSERIVGMPPSEASLRPEGDHKLTNNAH